MSDSGSAPIAEADAQPGPVCYRHPERETWVSCTRCNRPICPDCMNPASVGFQCPECVREGKRTVRVPTTLFGGSQQGERGLVTRILIGINVAVWLLTIVIAMITGEIKPDQLSSLILSGGLTDLVQWGATLPAKLYLDGSISGGIAGGELWRLVTAGFFHNGLIHLGLNMYALWLLGQYCETLLGRWRFLALYLLSGIGGALAEFLFNDPGNYAAGASGSIFGLMAALFFFFRKMKTDVRAIVVLLLLNLMLGFFVPSISMLGHVGGLVVGGAVGAVLTYAPSGPNRTRIQIFGMIGIALVMAGLTAMRIAQYGII